MDYVLLSKKFESLQPRNCCHASLPPGLRGCQAPHADAKETVGKSISQAALIYTSLPRDSLYPPPASKAWCAVPGARRTPQPVGCHSPAPCPAKRLLRRAQGGHALLGSLPPGTIRRLFSQAANKQHARQQSACVC